MHTNLGIANELISRYADHDVLIDLRTMFAKFGPVDNVEIARDPGTGLSKGFAVVAMALDEDASAAIGRLNFTQYAGRTIGVSRSR